MFYVINATVLRTTKEGTTVHTVPTFYLSSDVQGIVDATHAETIAREVINPTKDVGITVAVYVASCYT